MPHLSRRAFATGLPLGIVGGGLLPLLTPTASLAATPATAASAAVATVTPLAQVTIGRFNRDRAHRRLCRYALHLFSRPDRRAGGAGGVAQFRGAAERRALPVQTSI